MAPGADGMATVSSPSQVCAHLHRIAPHRTHARTTGNGYFSLWLAALTAARARGLTVPLLCAYFVGLVQAVNMAATAFGVSIDSVSAKMGAVTTLSNLTPLCVHFI